MPAPTRASGRQRVYCSGACKAAAYRERQPGREQRRAELAAALDRLDRVGLRYLVDQVWDRVPDSAAATGRALGAVEAARQAELAWMHRIVRDGAAAAANDPTAPAPAARPASVGGAGRPRNRSQAARRLAAQLSTDLGAKVELRWDSSGASAGRPGGWAWHVQWSNGPTIDQLRTCVAEVIDQYPALQAEDLVYERIVQPVAVLLAMIGHLRAGQPACGRYRHELDLEYALAEVPYPERGDQEDLHLAARLGSLSQWRTDVAAELLDTFGLAVVTGNFAAADPGVPSSGTVVPISAPPTGRRSAGRTRARRPR